MENRLVLIIDPTEARKGSAEVVKVTNKVSDSADRATNAYAKLKSQMDSTMKTLSEINRSIGGNPFGKLTDSIKSANASLLEMSKMSVKMSKDFETAAKNIDKGSSSAVTGLKNLRESTDLTKGKFAELRKDISQSNTVIRNFSSQVSKSTKSIETSLNRTVAASDNFRVSINGIKTDVNSLSSRFSSLDGHVKNTRDNFKTLNSPLANAAKNMDKFNLMAIDSVYAVKELSRTVRSADTNIGTMSGKMDKASNSTVRFREQMVNTQATFVRLKNETNGLSSQIDRTDAKMKKLGNSFTQLSASMRAASAGLNDAVERLKRMQTELDQADRAMRSASQSTRYFSRDISGLTLLLGGMSLGNVIGEIGSMADKYTALQNRIAVVTGSTENLTGVTRQLLDVATDARTDLDSTVDVYSKLIRVNERYGMSQDKLMRLTETVSKAVSMSGASVAGAQGAMMQFSQALSGNFQASAQELNSIIEQTPALASVMAQALNKVNPGLNASVDNLKKLASEGKITTQALLEGLIMVSDEVDGRFNASQLMMSQAWQNIKDRVTVYVGELDKANGVTKTIAETMANFGKNLGNYTRELEAFTVAFGVLGAAVAIGATAMFAMFVGIPGLIVGAIAAVAGLVTYFRHDIVAGIEDAGFAISELLIGTGEEFVSNVGNMFYNFFDNIANFGRKARDLIFGAIHSSVEYIKENLAGSVMEGVLLTFLKRFELMYTHIESFGVKVVASVVKGTQDVLNKGMEYVNKFINTVVEQYNKLLNLVGKESISLGEIKGFTFADNYDSVIEQADLAIENARTAVEEQRKATQLLIKNKKEELAFNREFESAMRDDEESRKKRIIDRTKGSNQIKNAAQGEFKEMEKLAKQYESMRKTLDPLYAAEEKRKEQMILLNMFAKQGSEEYKKYAQVIANDYKKAVESVTREKSFESIRQELDGTKSAYDSYYSMVDRITESNATQIQKVQLLQEAFRNLNLELAENARDKGDVTSGAPSISGFEIDPIDKFQKEREALEWWFETQQGMYTGNYLKLEELKAAHAEREKALDLAVRDYQLMNAQQTFGTLSSIAAGFAGEQSSLYQTLFAMEKAFAVARALMRIPEAYSQAYNAVVGLPIIGPAMAPVAGATASAAMVAQAAGIGSVQLTGMSHDGYDSIPKTGTWLLEKGERVTTEKTSAKLDNTLDEVINSNRSGEGRTIVNQTINITGRVDNRTSSQIANDTARKQKLVERRFGRV